MPRRTPSALVSEGSDKWLSCLFGQKDKPSAYVLQVWLLLYLGRNTSTSI